MYNYKRGFSRRKGFSQVVANISMHLKILIQNIVFKKAILSYPRVEGLKIRIKIRVTSRESINYLINYYR